MPFSGFSSFSLLCSIKNSFGCFSVFLERKTEKQVKIKGGGLLRHKREIKKKRETYGKRIRGYVSEIHP